MEGTPFSRYSFIGGHPRSVVHSQGRSITVWENGLKTTTEGNPFDEIDRRLRNTPRSAALPHFTGGAVGYWGYDVKDHLENLPSLARDHDCPDAAWMFVDAVIVVDHSHRETFLAGTQEGVDRLEASLHSPTPRRVRTPCPYRIRPTIRREDYLDRIQRIRQYIASGDVYEVNLTQRFDVLFDAGVPSPVDLFRSLTTVSPSPFSALIEFGDFAVISSSPERFLRVQGREIESRPIKGTRPRSMDFHEDERNFLHLMYSSKDRAENTMIVDLVRNDIGRVAQTGSVRVPQLCAVEPYSTVFQMVSTVTGQLDVPFVTMDAVKACFPPGSMTGAPKIRAMEIIEELEPFKRGIYSGALGYMGYDGHCDLSVVIRTMILEKERAYFQTGGAIVWDSDPESEYQECLDKAKGIIKSLEELRMENPS